MKFYSLFITNDCKLPFHVNEHKCIILRPKAFHQLLALSCVCEVFTFTTYEACLVQSTRHVWYNQLGREIDIFLCLWSVYSYQLRAWLYRLPREIDIFVTYVSLCLVDHIKYAINYCTAFVNNLLTEFQVLIPLTIFYLFIFLITVLNISILYHQ